MLSKLTSASAPTATLALIFWILANRIMLLFASFLPKMCPQLLQGSTLPRMRPLRVVTLENVDALIHATEPTQKGLRPEPKPNRALFPYSLRANCTLVRPYRSVNRCNQ